MDRDTIANEILTLMQAEKDFFKVSLLPEEGHLQPIRITYTSQRTSHETLGLLHRRIKERFAIDAVGTDFWRRRFTMTCFLKALPVAAPLQCILHKDIASNGIPEQLEGTKALQHLVGLLSVFRAVVDAEADADLYVVQLLHQHRIKADPYSLGLYTALGFVLDTFEHDLPPRLRSRVRKELAAAQQPEMFW